MNAFPDLFLQDFSSGPRAAILHTATSPLATASSFFHDSDGRQSIRSFGSSDREHESPFKSPGSTSANHLHELSSLYATNAKPWSLVAAIGMQDIVGCDRAQDAATCLRVLAPYLTPQEPGRVGRGRDLQESQVEDRAQKSSVSSDQEIHNG